MTSHKRGGLARRKDMCMGWGLTPYSIEWRAGGDVGGGKGVRRLAGTFNAGAARLVWTGVGVIGGIYLSSERGGDHEWGLCVGSERYLNGARVRGAYAHGWCGYSGGGGQGWVGRSIAF